jgi:hypothetical protein
MSKSSYPADLLEEKFIFDGTLEGKFTSHTSSKHFKKN